MGHWEIEELGAWGIQGFGDCETGGLGDRGIGVWETGGLGL